MVSLSPDPLPLTPLPGTLLSEKEKLYPKEKALIDLVAAERLEGRRVLVYVTHTGTRDITGRMDDILTRHGFRVAVMKADAVAPNRREKWVADKVQEGIDVMICHPRLVQTGLDLIDFQTIVWDEVDYSVYVVRQASRRSWRIGQTRPVKVVFMSYRNTLQADALKLVAKKMQSSLVVEGELPEDGLAAYGDDMMMALARKIVSGDEEDEAETMEEVFAQARNAESEAEELLVDDGWKPVDVEPEAIDGNGDGHHDGIGPMVELVPANGRHANGHHIALEKGFVQRGSLTADELQDRVELRRRNHDAPVSQNHDSKLRRSAWRDRYSQRSPKYDGDPAFSVGDAVLTRHMDHAGHTRIPQYAQGKRGAVHALRGVFDLLDLKVQSILKPEPVYTVGFDARELWGDEAESPQRVYIDLWESCLLRPEQNWPINSN